MPQTPEQARAGYTARNGKSTAQRLDAENRLTETPASQALRLIAAQGQIGFQALSAVAENVEIQERALGLRVTEKRTYQRGDSSHSYFQDLMSRQTGYGYPAEARARLDRHAAEVREDAPVARARMEARAAAEYERHIAGTREGEQALARMQRLGIRPFETRAIDTSAGSAGDFVPPQWLLEDWVQAPRTGRAFADLWPTLPIMMNSGISVNVPRWSTGLSAAPQTAGGAAIASSSPADTFSTCPLRTVAGYADVSAQWAEQGVRISDDVIFGELMADLASCLDAQLLIGSGIDGPADRRHQGRDDLQHQHGRPGGNQHRQRPDVAEVRQHRHAAVDSGQRPARPHGQGPRQAAHAPRRLPSDMGSGHRHPRRQRQAPAAAQGRRTRARRPR